MMNENIVIFWFRRDLRVEDNAGLFKALTSGYKVLPVFIYDSNILRLLEPDDRRITFLAHSLEKLQRQISSAGGSVLTLHGTPAGAFRSLINEYNIKGVYFNDDYEPYSIERDREITILLNGAGITAFSFKDQVIFGKNEVVKSDGKPYTVFTPYSRKWLSLLRNENLTAFPSETLLKNLASAGIESFYPLKNLGFRCPPVLVKPPVLEYSHIADYGRLRDFPSKDAGSYLGPHLRFGTISIRDVLRRTENVNRVFTVELIWREFFMQILHHFPRVVNDSFRPGYDRILWINNEELFNKWCEGITGFPLVDAGMRELNETGYMHNRVRMVAANFLTRHLLTDWRWGEAWFASKLLDFELSSNNGNWQWSAGTGCDAAPYFRVFNPEIQVKKFDRDYAYIKKWVPESGTPDYPRPVVDHSAARERALKHYRDGIRNI